jgi:hypothetical protein
VAGEPIGPIVTDYNSSLAERAVPEWQATLDALQALPQIGTGSPIGYSGIALASAIGLQLTAIEPRITAAVFGGVLVNSRRTTRPGSSPAISDGASRRRPDVTTVWAWGLRPDR